MTHQIPNILSTRLKQLHFWFYLVMFVSRSANRFQWPSIVRCCFLTAAFLNAFDEFILLNCFRLATAVSYIRRVSKVDGEFLIDTRGVKWYRCWQRHFEINRQGVDIWNVNITEIHFMAQLSNFRIDFNGVLTQRNRKRMVKITNIKFIVNCHQHNICECNYAINQNLNCPFIIVRDLEGTKLFL